jgi:carbon monoxide dehydrogenase subunit G
MTQYKSQIKINAPKELVFQTVAHIENFSKAIPHIIKVEFLSEIHSGVGTRFKETRLMNKREASTELEVTQYLENESIRLVSDAGGTIWDTEFKVKEADDGVELRMVMDAKPKHILARFTTSLIKNMLQKALDADLRSVKEYCEKQTD